MLPAIRCFLVVLPALWGLVGCEQAVTPPDNNGNGQDTLSFTRTLTGQLLLENQAEHSNALVYLDSLDLGFRTDSNGYYTIDLPDSLEMDSGMVTIYYFVDDYDLESAKIALQDSQVILDSLDVDSAGTLPLRPMKQILQLVGWTDREEYRIGDSLDLHVSLRNLSEKTLRTFINGIDHYPGWLSLFSNDQNMGYMINFHDPSAIDHGVTLSPFDEYQDSLEHPIPIPDGVWYGSHFEPILPGEYTVYSSFFFEDRGYPIPQKIRDYLRDVYVNNLEYASFFLQVLPNKYVFPRIEVIE